MLWVLLLFFFINVDVRASLCVVQLILATSSEVNDYVNLQ